MPEGENHDLGFLYDEDRLLFKTAEQFQDLKRLGEIQAEANEYLRVVVVHQKDQRWFVLLDSQGFLAATKFPNKALRLCALESQNAGSSRKWLNREPWIPPVQPHSAAPTSQQKVQTRALPSLEDLDL